MSKGSKIVPVRIQDEMYAEMERKIASRNKASQEEPWTMSDFIRHCIRVKLSHGPRSKAAKKRLADRKKAAKAVAP